MRSSFLKSSCGFTRLWPSLAVGVFYLVSFFFLSVTLKHLSVGVAYAIWAGAGIALIALIGYVLFGQKLDAAALAGIGLIIVGVVVINVFSSAASAGGWLPAAARRGKKAPLQIDQSAIGRAQLAVQLVQVALQFASLLASGVLILEQGLLAGNVVFHSGNGLAGFIKHESLAVLGQKAPFALRGANAPVAAPFQPFFKAAFGCAIQPQAVIPSGKIGVFIGRDGMLGTGLAVVVEPRALMSAAPVLLADLVPVGGQAFAF